MELLVVVLIIALLAILGTVQFLKTTETGRADQAINTIQQIAAAQHMYALDAGSNLAQQAIGQITDACNDSSQICSTATNPQCNLVRCNFLSKRDWDSFPYYVFSLNPVNTSGDASLCFPNGTGSLPPGSAAPVACAARKVCGVLGATTNCVPSTSKYANWAYVIDSSGALFAINGAIVEEGATASH